MRPWILICKLRCSRQDPCKARNQAALPDSLSFDIFLYFKFATSVDIRVVTDLQEVEDNAIADPRVDLRSWSTSENSELRSVRLS